MNIGEKYFCSKCIMEIEDEMICPYCGHDPDTPVSRTALEEGTLLYNRRYQLGSVLGTGGFGITYAAWDYTLSQGVAIKEYFPFSYASRDVWESDTVVVTGNDENIFQNGLQRFSREARILATLQNIKSVVTVFDWFEANGTAYIVMEFVRGKTIDQYVKENNISPQKLIEMMRDLVDSLVSIHAQGVLHRDISPSNIMVQSDETIKLIDFGAAVVEERRIQGKDRTVVFNRKFAPVEQYDEEGLQGPWTDVYALSATIYYLITGKYPQEAMARKENDTLKSLRSQKIHLKKWQERAIREGMILDPEKRIQSMNIFRSYLYHLPMPEEIRMKRRLFFQYAVGNMAVLAVAGLLVFFSLKGSEAVPSHILMDVDKEDFNGESLPYNVSGLDINVFGNSNYNRNEIKSITFLDSLENAGEDAWDVSKDDLGGVIAWVEKNEDLYDLYIASDGKVLADQNCKNLFACFENLESINFNDCFDTSGAVSMENMFYRCEQIEDLNLSGINTSCVNSMNDMFYYCKKIEKLDVSNLDTSSVTDMYGMFYHCENLTTLDISGFQTENVGDFRRMFGCCENLESINLENISTAKAWKMDAMFEGCKKLVQIDVSGFDTSDVTSMVSMFSECSALEKLDLGGFYAPKLEKMGYMFKECSNLTDLNLEGMLAGRVNDINGLFNGCESLVSLDLSGLDTSSVENMLYVFQDCKSLQEVDLSGWDISNVESMFYMFCDCIKLKTIYLPRENADRLTDMRGMFKNCSGLRAVDMSRFQASAVENMSSMFMDCINLTEVNLQGIHTENVTDMSSMFSGCASLEELNLDYFDTSSVTDMSWMFYECMNLKKLDISNFDTLELRHMEYMFGGCSSLSVVDLSGFVIAEDSIVFDTGMFYGTRWEAYELSEIQFLEGILMEADKIDFDPIIDVSTSGNNAGVFGNREINRNMIGRIIFCDSLKEKKAQSWDVSSIGDGSVQAWIEKSDELYDLYIGAEGGVKANEYCGELFACFENVTEIRMGKNFDTSGVKNMELMFHNCRSLEKIDVSGFDTSNVVSMRGMFQNCESLGTLDLSGFKTGENLEDMWAMFYHCYNLRSINFSGFETSQVRNMCSLFDSCYLLKNIDLSCFDTGKVSDMRWMFYGCKNLKTLDVSNFDFMSAYQEDYALTDTLWDGMTLRELKKEQFVAQ